MMKKPLRILRLIARLNVGGPAIQAITLSSKLPADKYKTLLVCGSISPGEGDMIYLAFDRGVQPYVIKEFGRNLSVTQDVKSFFIIRKIIRQFKPDILHTHTAKAGTLGRLAVLSLGIPCFSSRKIRSGLCSRAVFLCEPKRNLGRKRGMKICLIQRISACRWQR